MTPRYEKQKNKLKEELKKEDSLLIEHTYTIIDKKKRETSITIDDLIADANIEQLNKCREYLIIIRESIQEHGFYSDDQLDIPMEEINTLKIKFKQNKSINS